MLRVEVTTHWWDYIALIALVVVHIVPDGNQIILQACVWGAIYMLILTQKLNVEYSSDA